MAGFSVRASNPIFLLAVAVVIIALWYMYKGAKP